MLKVDSLKKVFKAKKLRVNALNGVSFILPDTGLVFILGKSGSGKSTLLHLLGGLDRPTSGSITVDGEELTYLPCHGAAGRRGRQGCGRSSA